MVTLISEEDLDKPVVRKKLVSVHNDGSMKAVVDCGEYGSFVTDEPVAHGGGGEGPSPLQAVLGSLSGCKAVTFNRTAKEFGLKYDGIDFESSFTIDIRGRQGVRGVVPHFKTVRVQANVKTDESEEKLLQVIEEVGARCPVYNLLKDANVNVEFTWVRCPTGS